MSRYCLITDSGSLVSLASTTPDAAAIEVATSRLVKAGVSGFVAQATGPASDDGGFVLLRAFGSPAATFAAARARVATRKRTSGNSVFRVGNR